MVCTISGALCACKSRPVLVHVCCAEGLHISAYHNLMVVKYCILVGVE